MSGTIYVPPKDLRVRLLGYVSQYVLVSRTQPEPQVWHHPYDDQYEDQWFTLVPGTGDRKGLYLIKSVVTHKVLFSRTYADPQLWHIDGDGAYDDNWFELEPGKGKYDKFFRLINPYTNTAIFSRTGQSPEVWNHPAGGVYADQYFSFLFPDMQVVHVDYDLDLGNITNATPTVLATQTLTNNTSREQTMSVDLNETETHTSTWDYTTGFTITIGASFSAGIPMIGETTFKVDTAIKNEWKWGGANTFSKSWKASFPAKAGPGETVRALSTVTRGQLEVPYTITLRSKDTQTEVTTSGTWRGVSTWDLRHTVSIVDKK